MYEDVKIVKEYKGAAKTFVENVVARVTETEKDKIGILEFMKLYKDECGTTVVQICGGNNGRSDWEQYFKSLIEIAKEFKRVFGRMWLIELYNDCSDDVWYAKFGIEFDADKFENDDVHLEHLMIE